MGDTSSNGTGTYAPATWMGFSADAVAPAAGDVTVASEINAGPLARAQAVFAHTSGSASYTLTRSVTSDQNVTLRKLGVYTAASPGGVLVFEASIPDPPGLVPGDTIQTTHTVQL